MYMPDGFTAMYQKLTIMISLRETYLLSFFSYSGPWFRTTLLNCWTI
jgi:hypothetical protein